ncbi:hypothetical protein A1O3_00545 [Capronia epimyces CBS 606.96]|uniref:Uncharacterized protein n=1 Tax=Capronia epimyces CBS 606.96 TaxID=1182542 RepID=W9YQQ7_9EURO|nr:uncharacterized protein A1O3_00545 [Capronia epimyces CBS 606.96]EXJ91995.1 hypothetical protein A1O3_00545 [Capronia epimyces CBS 606.96]
MASGGSCNPSSTLSPKQRFQAHVRTLSSDSISTSGSQTSPQRSPELQHVSSLRVQSRESPSLYQASRPNSVYKFGDEPPFIRQEREAWSRASPSRQRGDISPQMYILPPPEQERPAMQPAKHMKETNGFAPLAGPIDVDARLKTGQRHNHNSNQERQYSSRNSKFAEGSMNERSTGVSSTWLEHESDSCISDTESDNDSTPRASPQRSSVDLEEFKPAAVTPATLRQRLFKIGTAFKSHEHARKQVESETQPEGEKNKKKKGLRKSISMWNIHNVGGKMKTFGGSSTDLTPKAATQDKTLEVLNDRKRKAEEAYAQQFGPKKRKSNVGQETNLHEQAPEKTPSATGGRPVSRRESKTPIKKRRTAQPAPVEITADCDIVGSHSDIDHHKRPSRRELEKENQQLRAMLRQQHQEPVLELKDSQPKPTSTSLQPPAESGHESDMIPAKLSCKKPNQKPRRELPPIPQIPERIVLKNLSNTRQQPQAKAKNMNNNANTNTSPNHIPHIGPDAAKEVKPISAVPLGLPRPFSVILEEDEEAEIKSPSPQCARRLESGEVEKIKIHGPTALQMKGVKREQWEWPEDVF